MLPRAAQAHEWDLLRCHRVLSVPGLHRAVSVKVCLRVSSLGCLCVEQRVGDDV